MQSVVANPKIRRVRARAREIHGQVRRSELNVPGIIPANTWRSERRLTRHRPASRDAKYLSRSPLGKGSPVPRPRLQLPAPCNGRCCVFLLDLLSTPSAMLHLFPVAGMQNLFPAYVPYRGFLGRRAGRPRIVRAEQSASQRLVLQLLCDFS